jgi:hypothetical protein
VKLISVKEAIAAYGLAYRGGHHTSATDFLAEDHIRTLVLIGVIGREHWPSFTASSEAADGNAGPARSLVATHFECDRSDFGRHGDIPP